VKLPDAPRAVVTGAAGGLGRAIALELARRGGRVLVADVNREGAEETAEHVVRAGGQAEVRITDVTRADDLVAAADAADRTWGGADLLVNNAGVAAAGTMGDIPLEDWEWALKINLWGVIHGCHAFVPRMRARGGGAILNVASAAGIASLPEMGPYNVSKAAVISLTETLTSELAPHGIQVSALCPTFFPTNLMQSFRSSSERQRRLALAMFRRSTMTAEQVARAGIRGLERGKLLIVPQRDGRLAWWMKRLAYGAYYGALRFQQRRDLASMWLLRQPSGVAKTPDQDPDLDRKSRAVPGERRADP
jgi:NAD(P)-dependent dehydrogenase (short-subunit alcohol dehydrogenase family)